MTTTTARDAILSVAETAGWTVTHTNDIAVRLARGSVWITVTFIRNERVYTAEMGTGITYLDHIFRFQRNKRDTLYAWLVC